MFDGDTKCVGLARIGSSTQQIVYGAMRDLKDCDFGKPLHSFVIPGDVHFVEEEVLGMYSLRRHEDEDTKHGDAENDGGATEPEPEQKEAVEQWVGTDFTGIWTLSASDNLEQYLQSEGWPEVMRKAAASGTVTQQILQNEDTMKIKVFSSNGSYSYVVVVGGEAVEFTDLNGDCCSTTAEWDEDRKCVVEHIAKTLKKTESVRNYVTRRSLDDLDAKQMTLEITNESQQKLTRIYTKI